MPNRAICSSNKSLGDSILLLPATKAAFGSELFGQFAKFFMCSLVIEYWITNCCIHSLLKLNKFLTIDLLPLQAVALLTPNHLFLRCCLLVGCSPTPPLDNSSTQIVTASHGSLYRFWLTNSGLNGLSYTSSVCSHDKRGLSHIAT